MAYKGILVDKLVAKNGQMFISDSKGGYSQAYDYNTLENNAWVTKLMMISVLGGLSRVVQISFTSVSSVSIDWQTDIPAGETDTYANLLGNTFPNPIVYLLSTGTTYINPGTTPTIDYSAGLINTVTFDWGSVADGFIRF